MGSSYHIAAILASLFRYPRLSRALGKKRIFQTAAVILMLGCLSKLVLYRPGPPWPQLIVIAPNGLSNSGMALMAAAMLGDIADLDEWQTGLRREAVFSSVLSWADKAGTSFGALPGGYVLVWIGFNAKLGAQAPGTLEAMKFNYFLAPFLGALFAAWIIQRYALTEQRVSEIKAGLAQHRIVARPHAETARGLLRRRHAALRGDRRLLGARHPLHPSRCDQRGRRPSSRPAPSCSRSSEPGSRPPPYKPSAGTPLRLCRSPADTAQSSASSHSARLAAAPSSACAT
ncbi:MAG TPA: MFS transporter [Opitutaceae bacterium]